MRKAKIIQTATSNVDFVPTILSMMDVEPPNSLEFDGFDVSREVLNERKITNLDRVRYSFDGGTTVEWAVALMKQYKLVLNAWDVPWLFDLNADPYEMTNYFEKPGYHEVGTNLLQKLKSAMEKFEIPIMKFKTIFWSYPTCYDSRDRIDSVNPNGLIGTCKDLGDSVPENYCEREEWRSACPWRCKDCCKDSEGLIYLLGSLKTCVEVPRRECKRRLVREFCPERCRKCGNPWGQ